MAYWLVKSEPGTWSWDDMVKAGTTEWDGVRNHQANNNMKAMRKGDKCFFYHSGKTTEIVGIVEVVREHYPDPTDASARFGMVDVKAGARMKIPVTLSEIKATPALGALFLVRHSRLSVGPVGAKEWKAICKMGETKA